MNTQPRKFYEADDYGSGSQMVNDGTIIQFLQGSHSFDGVWYGEPHPKYEGNFWWRKFLPTSPQEVKSADIERIKEVLKKHFRDSIFACTRVWEAWQVGTMTQDDFTPLNECDEFLNDLASELASQLHPVSKSEGVGEELVYWRQRCLAAEHYIDKSPCDPDIAEKQMTAYAAWKNYLNNMPDFPAPVSKDALTEAVEDAGQRGEVDFPAQVGKSATADFEENTWTFEMPEDFEVIAGEFLIIPKANYKAKSSTPVQEGWVRVEDGLPEPAEMVLVYNNRVEPELREVTIACFDTSEGLFYLLEINTHSEDVTHWMPLPSAPETIL